MNETVWQLERAIGRQGVSMKLPRIRCSAVTTTL